MQTEGLSLLLFMVVVGLVGIVLMVFVQGPQLGWAEQATLFLTSNVRFAQTASIQSLHSIRSPFKLRAEQKLGCF